MKEEKDPLLNIPAKLIDSSYAPNLLSVSS